MYVTNSIINGKEVKTDNFASSYNPTSEEEIAKISLAGIKELDMAIQAGKRAFHSWSQLSFKERGAYLSRTRELILEQAEEITKLIALEQGKPATEAKTVELFPVIDNLKYLAKHAEKALRKETINYQQVLYAHKKGYFLFEPLGVMAVISPWNFPFSIPFLEVISAIICGNTVVLKPAPETMLVGLKIGELFTQADLPPGVVNVIASDNKIAQRLTEHPEIAKILFTGSVETGKKIMSSASKNLTPVVLELGGKDAAVVTKDADLERTAKGIVWGAFMNSGQACASVERVYAEKEIAQKLIDLCVEETKKLKVGDPTEEGMDLGPMTLKNQVGKVEDHIADAKAKGAKVLLGGERPKDKGYYFPPTIITDVNHSMKIMKEETFGPVLPIMVVDNLDEAIELANDSEYGLCASGWTKNKKTAQELQKKLQAGTVTINDAISSFAEPCAAWGGVKESGFGRTHSKFGLLEMVNVKHISYDSIRKNSMLWWYPYDREFSEFFKVAIPALHSSKLTTKLKNLMGLMKFKRLFQRTNFMDIVIHFRKLF